ncbi:MAG: hypothetical protein HY034_08260 [Nitrospirae bacterium]|nr:hypothetical protein [Nitrospirota bacterium]
MNKDNLWVVKHFSDLVKKYHGKAIAVVNERIVAVGDTELEVEQAALKKFPAKIPSVMRVPREEDLVCLL